MSAHIGSQGAPVFFACSATARACGPSPGEVVVPHVGQVEDRLHREEEERPQRGTLLGLPLERAELHAVLERGLRPGEHLALEDGLLVAGARFLGDAVRVAGHGLEVRHRQLELEDLDVPQGVDRRLARNVALVEALNHLEQRVGLLQMPQELVPDPLALRSALGQAGDVDDADLRGDDLLGLDVAVDHLEPVVRHVHLGHVRLDGAEGVGRPLGPGSGGGVEDGGLPDVRESDDSAGEAHGVRAD